MAKLTKTDYFDALWNLYQENKKKASMPPHVGGEEQKYVVHVGGQAITEPKTYKQIIQDHGDIKRLEASGARVLPHVPKTTPKPPPLPKQTKTMGKNQDIKIPKKEFIKEHKRLIDVLESPSHKDDVQEAKKQRKELKEINKSDKYFQNLKKGYAQKKLPVDPNKESQMNAMLIDKWQNEQYTPTRALIKPLTGNLRQRALNRLAGTTKVRKAKDGKREFLLYRGVSDSEKDSALDNNVLNYPENQYTSWTPHQGIAGRFANSRMGHIIGAWIHENDIQHYPKMVGNVYERHKGKPIKSANDYAGEDEIIVRHTRPHEGHVTHSFSTDSNFIKYNTKSPIKNEIKPERLVASEEKKNNEDFLKEEILDFSDEETLEHSTNKWSK
jgi:hypothetical protein